MSDVEVRRASLLEVSPFDSLYGLEILERSDELVQGRVPVRRELMQPTGIVHGGVYAAIAEGLASLGTNSGVASAGEIGLGMSNQSSFLRPLAKGTIHAVARRRHRGRNTWIWDVEMSDDEGRVCALSRVAVAVRAGP